MHTNNPVIYSHKASLDIIQELQKKEVSPSRAVRLARDVCLAERYLLTKPSSTLCSSGVTQCSVFISASQAH